MTGQEIPAAEPRIPQRQLLIEMAAMIKQHVRSLMNTEVKSVIRPLPKYSPSHEVCYICNNISKTPLYTDNEHHYMQVSGLTFIRECIPYIRTQTTLSGKLAFH